MSEDPKTRIIVSQRRWMEKKGDVASHYETLDVQVSFPANFLVQYEPTQHTLIIKAPGGQVRAAYRDIIRLLTPDVVIEELNEGTS